MKEWTSRGDLKLSEALTNQALPCIAGGKKWFILPDMYEFHRASRREAEDRNMTR